MYGCYTVAKALRGNCRTGHPQAGNFRHRYPPPRGGKPHHTLPVAQRGGRLYSSTSLIQNMLTTEEKTQAVVAALEDIKANDITVIDTSNLSSMFERMIIASANSTRQTKALADNVVVKLKERGEHLYGREGEDSGEWILIDFGEV